MPILGLGVHVLIALYFAVHAVRSGQNMYWLFILFSFPLLGSLVYFVVIYLPDSRLEYGARKAVAGAAKLLDPGRELREAQAAYEYTPSAQNQMRLAAAQLVAGMAEASAASYGACLQGPLGGDPEIRFGAARALLACARDQEAIAQVQAIRQQNPDFRSEQLSLVLAQALAGTGEAQAARAEFEASVARFGSFEAKAEFYLWAVGAGEEAIASRLKGEIEATVKHWTKGTRRLNSELLQRLQAASAKR